MKYVISDIHGCYKEYKELLKKIEFTDEDDLYVLGDVVDRGPEPIRVLKDMMMRINVYLILGNHEYMMMKVLKKLNTKISEETVEGYLKKEDLEAYQYWIQDGGDVTARQFTSLSLEDREEVMEFVEDAMLYDVVKANGKVFVLTHAGIHGFAEKKSLDDYSAEDLVLYRADYKKRYFSNPKVRLVTGHTPTPKIRADKKAEILECNGHIAMDCGCVYGGRLAAYCFDTGERFYVDKK